MENAGTGPYVQLASGSEVQSRSVRVDRTSKEWLQGTYESIVRMHTTSGLSRYLAIISVNNATG